MRPHAAATSPDSTVCVRRALTLFAGALLLRAIYFILIRRTACLDINLDPISDMETFHRWALTIVNGDWLGRGDFHPFHPWQAAVASKEQWARWYGHVYHQEPFYAYLVAAVYLLAPREPQSVILLQLVLGAAGCAATYLAARRIVSEGTALTAGWLSVLYGPYLYYESLVLRDSFMIPLDAMILWVVLEARARHERGQAKSWWLAAGLLIGLAYITKATILPFFVLLLCWSFFERGSRAMRERAAPVLLLLAGFALITSPVFARNVAVGAPPLKITTRGPIEFINGNNAWHIGIGWFDGDDQRVSGYAREILAQSNGSLPGTVAVVVRGWSGNLTGLLRLQMVKTAYFFAPFEMPNNASYSYFRLNCPLLRIATLSFYSVSPLALLGVLVSWRRRAVFAPLYFFLASGIVTTIIFYVIARFRAPFMPAILILSACGLCWLVEQVRTARWGRVALAVLLLAAGLGVNAAASFQDEDLVRPQDYLISIQGYLSRGLEVEALEEAERGRRIFPGFAEFHKAAARIYLRQGRSMEALRAFREALARDPSDPESREMVLRLQPPP